MAAAVISSSTTIGLLVCRGFRQFTYRIYILDAEQNKGKYEKPIELPLGKSIAPLG
jgi:hypothetical protein